MPKERLIEGTIMKNIIIIGICFSGLLFCSAVNAECHINDNEEPTTSLFTIPPLTINADAAPGTIISTQKVSGKEIKVHCTGGGAVYTGYSFLTDADERSDNPLSSVYQTNVPGVGIRIAWSKDSTTFNSNSWIKPIHRGSASLSSTTYPLMSYAEAQFVVTGIVESGVVNAEKLNADWMYDGTLTARIRYSPITINVTANTCNLVEKNITVPLNDITTSDIKNGFSEVVSDNRFKIQLERCAAGIKVDYRFTTAGSTGVSGNSDILAIASGNGAAEGVGLQILDSNNNVLKFDNDYNVAAQTTDGQSVGIPLKARYVQTGTVKAGKVDSVATFDVFYR